MYRIKTGDQYFKINFGGEVEITSEEKEAFVFHSGYSAYLFAQNAIQNNYLQVEIVT